MSESIERKLTGNEQWKKLLRCAIEEVGCPEIDSRAKEARARPPHQGTGEAKRHLFTSYHVKPTIPFT
jgi:hypothetical protein